MNIEQKDLAKALRLVAPAVARGSQQLPILSGVHIGSATLMATNGDMAISTSLVSDFEAVVPHSIFTAFISQLEGTISLELVDNDLQVSAGGASIKLRTYPLEDWPRWPNLKDPKQVDGIGVFEAMRRVAYAASKDDARPILTCVCVKDGWVVATDSYRLAAIPTAGEASGLIPASALRAIGRAVGAPTIHMDSSRAQFTTDDLTVSVRQMTGEFPNWQRLIPDDSKTPIVVDRASMCAALERCLPLHNAEQPVIIEPTDSGIMLRLTSQDVGIFQERIKAEASTFDKVAFHPGYLLETLNALTEDIVSVHLNGTSKPALIREGELVNILMPVRVS